VKQRPISWSGAAIAGWPRCKGEDSRPVERLAECRSQLWGVRHRPQGKGDAAIQAWVVEGCGLRLDALKRCSSSRVSCTTVRNDPDRRGEKERARRHCAPMDHVATPPALPTKGDTDGTLRSRLEGEGDSPAGGQIWARVRFNPARAVGGLFDASDVAA
jgi:hypothetical protein